MPVPWGAHSVYAVYPLCFTGRPVHDMFRMQFSGMLTGGGQGF